MERIKDTTQLPLGYIPLEKPAKARD